MQNKYNFLYGIIIIFDGWKSIVKAMDIKKVVVAGGGVLGSQIAFQAAYCGLDVTIWLRSEGSITRTKPKINALRKSYLEAIDLMSGIDPLNNWCRGIADMDNFSRYDCIEAVNNAYDGLKIELDLAAAVKDADIVIESVAENVADKTAFYQTLAPLLPKKTILVTNSSTLLPSTFEKFTGRSDKYLSLHFANSIWKNNTAEIMAQPKTDPKIFDEVVKFANQIRMVALPVLKEKNGYLLNSMLVPFLLSGLDLYVNEVSDPESIDKAWTLGTGAPRGPFQIFDVVGIQTAYNIVQQYQKVPGLFTPMLKKMLLPYNFKGMEKVLGKMIAEGKLGKSSGEGFYKYE